MISRVICFKFLDRDMCRKKESSGHGLSEPIFERKTEHPLSRFMLVFGGKQSKHRFSHLGFRGPQQRYLQKEKVWTKTRERRAHSIEPG